MPVISPFLTFPEIGWWQQVAGCRSVMFDIHENYQKMSGRNRYRLSGSNNAVLLSVPLQNGRNQNIPIADVRIANDQKWQVQHWRTLVSVYNRSPYFFHYEPSLRPLYEQEFVSLVNFNRASVQWVKQQIGLTYEETLTSDYQKDYPGFTDLREGKNIPVSQRKYYQVFEDRVGFIPALSILDLLFSEGPHTAAWLKQR